MTLLTAHRILIATATIFFVFYALWEFKGAQVSGASAGVLRGVASLVAAGGLGGYFLTLKRRDGGPS